MADTSTAAEATRSPSPQTPPRWMWVLLMLLFSALVGTVGGLLAYASDKSIPGAILYGGGTFGGCLLLLIAVAHYAGGDRS